MNNKIDLHIHSVFSDGTDTPDNIVKEAIKKDIHYISLTDHESIEGYKYLLTKKDSWQSKIMIIPGVELHTFYKGYEIHILGYFLNDMCLKLNKKLKELRNKRTEIAYDIVDNLNKNGYYLNWDDVQDFEGDIAITKAHVIDALRIANIKISKDAFFDFFNPWGKHYIPFRYHHLEDALQLIKDCGGVSVLAHPGLIGNDEVVSELIKTYKLGMEVYYHYFGDKAEFLVKKYEELAKKHNFLVTGGSDYHGTITPVSLGDTRIPLKVIENLFNS